MNTASLQPATGPDGLPQRLSEVQASHYLGLSPATLRKSRTTGVLSGVAAPKYLKLGRRVFYPLAGLDAWLSQFDPVANTTEAAQGGKQ